MLSRAFDPDSHDEAMHVEVVSRPDLATASPSSCSQSQLLLTCSQLIATSLERCSFATCFARCCRKPQVWETLAQSLAAYRTRPRIKW